MPRTCSLFLGAAALAVLAGAVEAQTLTPSSNSVTLAYAKLAETNPAPNTSVTVTASADGTGYSVTGGASWLLAACSACTAGTNDGQAGGAPDTVSFAVVESAADVLTNGTYSATVNLQVGGVTQATVSVQLTLSPLTSTPSAISLTYVVNGVANQAAAKTTSSVSDSNLAADTYSIGSTPAWLSVNAAHGSASASSSDTLTFQAVASAANSLPAGTTNTAVHLSVAGSPDLVIPVSIKVMAQQPLSTATTLPLVFNYTAGASSAPAAQTASIAAAGGSIGFSLDPSTLPAWLGVTLPSPATATTGGVSVTFTPVAAVVKALAAGNYSGSVGLQAANATHELTISVQLSVSNPTATVSIQGPTTNSATLNYPGASLPVPTTTVVSSDEPTAFSATCSVQSTYPGYVPSQAPCQLNVGATRAVTVTGIAYTYGMPMTTTFDPALFLSGTPYGTVITETVTVTAGSQAPVSATYAYTVQPVAPTFTAVSPTSAAAVPAGDSLVFTLTGTNFVGPNSILPGSTLSPTKVWVGTFDVTANAVVIDSTRMLVSVPGSDFPAIAAKANSAAMVVGLANQIAKTAPTAPAVTQNVSITTAPVVYAVTSTATYMQPNPGTLPKVAPFELVSIFGANFGVTGSVSGALNSFNQFPATVNASGLGTSGSPFVTLSVSFKSGATTYKAPILFANASQINCIVPSGLPVGPNAAVTVTYGTASSDGLFNVSVAASQPGIFTLASDGVGQGAILNADFSVNSSTNPAAAGSMVAIYMTGLGVPNSTAVDSTAIANAVYSTSCVEIGGTTAAPGYLQLVNTKTASYTPPATPWTNIDGAVIEPQFLLGHALPPCFVNAGATAIGVNFGSTPASVVGYAGFVGGAVAGLYQINVLVPASLTTGTYAVTVSIGSASSPAGMATISIQ